MRYRLRTLAHPLIAILTDGEQLGNDNAEWGPDLAFIRLPKNTALKQTLCEVKVNFYALPLEDANDPRPVILRVYGN